MSFPKKNTAQLYYFYLKMLHNWSRSLFGLETRHSFVSVGICLRGEWPGDRHHQVMTAAWTPLVTRVNKLALRN
jgi:hypothetical protein